uniref:Uncharacterized protein n=1 Tax=Kalanchoe fedtschenkoi TaxID=63787 RepID=A0A7N0VEQ5_KALFE
MADSGSRTPHMLVITFPAIGHINPQLKLAHHLLAAGLTLTFMLTPKNLKPLLSLHSCEKIRTLVLPLPDTPGLPPGVENLAEVPGVHLAWLFVQAYANLSALIRCWVESHPYSPMAIMSDIFFSVEAGRLAGCLRIKLIGFSPQNALCVRGFWVRPKAAKVNSAIVSS